MQRRAFLAAGASVTAALAGCIGPSLSSSDYDIGMQSNAFVPDPGVEGTDVPTFEAAAGDTVVWANSGSRNHTVTGYDDGIPEGAEYFASGGFDNEQAARDAWANSIDGGGVVKPGETYEHTFEVPGDYYYVCIPHEDAGMLGKIVVTD
ncbi:plastocyanin/azurin family copper-binding protein [Halobacterium bonnevillei]|uniref:Halocyanin n=1 Tax=Halobacterium bonnevillei TaxID=2692200 RepID=A0A6B0SP81_9EURY|nr:plastocyanin/azurin family copper-binding protein [Halobacterium bonnevillei]MXR22286.1 halocyanin [Halobacterium bonnevillei]